MEITESKVMNISHDNLKIRVCGSHDGLELIVHFRLTAHNLRPTWLNVINNGYYPKGEGNYNIKWGQVMPVTDKLLNELVDKLRPVVDYIWKKDKAILGVCGERYEFKRPRRMAPKRKK